MERVSTFGLGQAMIQSALSVQSRFATASAQKASGLVGTTYSDLGSKASTLISTETALAQVTTWKANTEIANDRVQGMYTAVGSIIDQLTALRRTLSAAKSSTGYEGDLNEVGKALMADLANQMNVRQDGRYLFAGSNTNVAPVDTSLLTPVATAPTLADTAYYTGDSQIASVRVSDQLTVNYGVTANGSAFEKALRAANLMSNMTTSPLDQAAWDEIYELANQSIDGMISVRSGMSTAMSRLEGAVSRHDITINLFDGIASGLKEVDVAAATVKISAFQTQLQASYSALAKVNELSLVKYL